MSDREPITERLARGDRSALARLITWAENADPRFPDAVSKLYGRVGRAWRTGVTGPPGTGKSTLVNALTQLLRGGEHTVAVLAVDPSSPFTGGALLGDRIRMEERTMDPGVFIRSMASRSSRGGLARAAVDACDVMDAFGFDHVLLETVGVGQAEYDVLSAADTLLVVLCPGAGDGIQAMKAGLLEVADVLVVNKSDREGADRLVTDLEEAVHIRLGGRSNWGVPVVACSASSGEGVPDVADAVARHRAWLEDGRLDEARRKKRIEQVQRVVGEELEEALWERSGWRERVETLLAGGRPPYDVVREVLAGVLGAVTGTDLPGIRSGATR